MAAYKKPKLQAIYEGVFEEAVKNGYNLNDKVLEKFRDIMTTLDQDFTNIHEASKKFDIFANLQLVEEMLNTKKPIAFGANVSFKEFRRDPNDTSDSDITAFISVRIPHHGTDVTFHSGQQIFIAAKDMAVALKILKHTSSNSAITLTGKFHKDVNKYKELCKNQVFHVFILPNDHLYKHTIAAIGALNDDLMTPKIFPNPTTNALGIHQYNQSMAKWVRDTRIPSLNPKQMEAVYGITRILDSTFVLFGPPGTGKTTTLVEAVYQLTQLPEFEANHFLVCAPSNMAADAFGEALLKRGGLEHNQIFRFMPENRDASERNPALTSITRFKEMYGGWLSSYVVPGAKDMRNFKVIISTLGSSPTLKQFFDAGHVSHIFIDEAGLSTEMESWLPLGHLATPKTRLILAGDPKLLGPVCTTRVLTHRGFKRSLLQRLTEIEAVKNDPRYLIQLTNNYRSHPIIVAFASGLFYDNSLVPMRDHKSALLDLPFIPNRDFPMMFHNVRGREHFDHHSCSNKAEVKIIMKYVQQCLRGGIKPEEIGVVSPYKLQAKLIRNRIRNPNITVETVEKFQGSERRVIIITTTRTKRLGFVAEDLRMNTAITRARDLVIMIGSKTALEKFSWYKRYIEICIANKSYITEVEEEAEESIDDSDEETTENQWEMISNLRIE